MATESGPNVRGSYINPSSKESKRENSKDEVSELAGAHPCFFLAE